MDVFALRPMILFLSLDLPGFVVNITCISSDFLNVDQFTKSNLAFFIRCEIKLMLVQLRVKVIILVDHLDFNGLILDRFTIPPVNENEVITSNSPQEHFSNFSFLIVSSCFHRKGCFFAEVFFSLSCSVLNFCFDFDLDIS